MIGHGMRAHEERLDEVSGKSWDFSDDAELVVASVSSVRVLATDGFQAFTLREGEGVFIPPRTISSIIAADGSALIHSVSFPLSVIWGDTESVVFRKYSERLMSLGCAVSLSPSAAGNAEKAFSVLAEEGPCYELEARDLISAVMIAILNETEGAGTPDRAFSNARILSIITFIKEHYSSRITLSDIAAAGNISERECLRSFRKSLGTSPVQYLISYRLSESLKFLADPELQISEVAYRSGFESLSHFSRSFREVYGCSPSEWRRRR